MASTAMPGDALMTAAWGRGWGRRDAGGAGGSASAGAGGAGAAAGAAGGASSVSVLGREARGGGLVEDMAAAWNEALVFSSHFCI